MKPVAVWRTDSYGTKLAEGEVRRYEDLEHSSYYYGDRVLERKTAIFSDPNKVSYVESGYRTGVNRHAGTRWFRWERQIVYVLYRNKNGLIVPLQKYGPHFQAPTFLGSFGAHSSILFNSESFFRFEKEVERNLGVRNLLDIYPLLNLWLEVPEDSRYSGFVVKNNNQLSPWVREGWEYIPSWPAPKLFRHTDFKEYLTELLGETPRKDLIKAAARLKPSDIHMGAVFRGHVHIDRIRDFYISKNEAGSYNALSYSEAVEFRRVLAKHLTPRSKVRLLSNGHDVYHVRDALRQLLTRKFLPGTVYDVKNWKELHDLTIHYAVPKQVSVNKKFPQKSIKHLNGKISGTSLSVHMAKDVNDITSWGTTMKNCIASYSRQATKGNVYLGAVFNNDILIGNFELNNTTDGEKPFALRQLLGKHNKPLDPVIRHLVESYLRGHKVQVPSTYWGRE